MTNPIRAGAGDGCFFLLAEDDENDVFLISRAIERLHPFHRLIAVRDGSEAIKYLGGTDNYADRDVYPFPGVVLLDYNMPQLSGLDTLCWLRDEPRFERLPVVVLSGAFSPAQIEMIQRLNAVCLVKTLGMTAIEQSIFLAVDLVNQKHIHDRPPVSD
jgi:CheY-like chemotaxis protein